MTDALGIPGTDVPEPQGIMGWSKAFHIVGLYEPLDPQVGFSATLSWYWPVDPV